MDDVSVLKFKFDIIRKPKKTTVNIFQYAASFKILTNDLTYLDIPDLCIIDFAYQLSQYDYNESIYHIIPIDSEDKILSLYNIGDIIKIDSMWTEEIIYVNKNQLKEEIVRLINDIEIIIGRKIDFFLK